MKTMFPDYDRSLLSLTASIQRHFGLETPHGGLPALDGALEKGPRNVVLMVFDGLGVSALHDMLPESAFLRRHVRATVSSVFPPTTTAATTTMETGQPPCLHGWLGWSLYFPELGKEVELFRNTVKDSGGQPAADFSVAPHFLPTVTLVDRMRDGGREAHVVSPFGPEPVFGLDALAERVAAICAEPGRHYIYAYCEQPDAAMHLCGVASQEARDWVRRIDGAVAGLRAQLRDTLLIVTADHGLLDVEYRYIQDEPDLAATLVRPPSMESRAASLWVRPGREDDFRAAFERAYGGDFLLLSRREVIERQLFGPGPVHPRFESSIGDFLAIAWDRACLVWGPCHESESFKAAHAGMTAQEMVVPVVLAGT